ncbi:MAG: polysaccharide biosynthesis C-terminal domain-containing protein [Puia sp.]|nr:polysaccharide biosynthesis C-terminal domain-containing protein [Puia sp.]
MADFKKKLFNGVLWRLVNIVSAFVFNIILVNGLGAADSGRFLFQLNNLSFIILFLGFGMESGMSYYATRREIPRSELFTIAVCWSIAASVLFTFLFYGSGFFSRSLVPEKTPFIPVYIFGSLLITFLGALFYSSHDNAPPNLLVAGANTLLIIVLAKYRLTGKPIGVESFINYYFIVYGLTGLLMALILFKKGTDFGRLRLGSGMVSPLLRYSFHSFMLAGLYTLLKRSDYWLVERFCTPGDMGNYIQSTKIIQLILLFPSLASFTLYPLLVESIHQQRDSEAKVIRLSAIYMLFAVIISTPIALLGFLIFPFLYGHTFEKMNHTVLLLIPGLVTLAGTYPLTAYFSGINRNSINISALTFSIIIMVISDLLLLPHYLIFGAAAGSSLAGLFYFAYLLLKFKKINNLTLTEISKTIKLKEAFFSLYKSAGR